MLAHPTHNRLIALGLIGMAKALEEQCKQPDIAGLDFDERLALRSTARPPSARTNVSSADCASRDYARMR
jgi:hypothetical protein